ncbi:Hypothetical predicted protein [Xyrichtys novacula]|uniref:Uncharacterized protein n=1 Tax=Xyrichtys novacula TaxID=13765 RepID=A0AAV1FGV6_XYRNO|nr:Hypothetical predicted protein [Xyrichtys novacula]
MLQTNILLEKIPEPAGSGLTVLEKSINKQRGNEVQTDPPHNKSRSRPEPKDRIRLSYSGGGRNLEQDQTENHPPESDTKADGGGGGGSCRTCVFDFPDTWNRDSSDRNHGEGNGEVVWRPGFSQTLALSRPRCSARAAAAAAEINISIRGEEEEERGGRGHLIWLMWRGEDSWDGCFGFTELQRTELHPPTHPPTGQAGRGCFYGHEEQRRRGGGEEEEEQRRGGGEEKMKMKRRRGGEEKRRRRGGGGGDEDEEEKRRRRRGEDEEERRRRRSRKVVEEITNLKICPHRSELLQSFSPQRVSDEQQVKEEEETPSGISVQL